METPNPLKGHMYPSRMVSRCPRFHACKITHKCQNFDQHRADCQFCEHRVVEKLNQIPEVVVLGGILPEGEYVNDLQDAIHIIEQARLAPLAHADGEMVTVGNTVDISKRLSMEAKATDMLAKFNQSGLMTISEEDIVNNDRASNYGRIE